MHNRLAIPCRRAKEQNNEALSSSYFKVKICGLLGDIFRDAWLRLTYLGQNLEIDVRFGVLENPFCNLQDGIELPKSV